MAKKEIRPGLFLTSDYCVWYEPKRTIILADFHLGRESSMKEQGVSLPRFQKDEILDRLSTIKEKYQPETFIVVGDLKHEFGKNREQEFEEVFEVMDYLTESSDLITIRGNHDNFLKTLTSKKGVPFYEYSMTVDDLFLTHGHKEMEREGTLIMAHEHPSIKIRDEIGAVLKFPCFLYNEKEDIIILPAFSPLAEGRDILSTPGFISSILDEVEIQDFKVFALTESGTGLIDFKTVKEVKKAYPDVM